MYGLLLEDIYSKHSLTSHQDYNYIIHKDTLDDFKKLFKYNNLLVEIPAATIRENGNLEFNNSFIFYQNFIKYSLIKEMYENLKQFSSKNSHYPANMIFITYYIKEFS